MSAWEQEEKPVGPPPLSLSLSQPQAGPFHLKPLQSKASPASSRIKNNKKHGQPDRRAQVGRLYHGGREQGAKGKSCSKIGEEDEGKRNDEGELVPSIEASKSIPWPSTCKSPFPPRANRINFPWDFLPHMIWLCGKWKKKKTNPPVGKDERKWRLH